jgi:hypothetical protein
MGESFWEARQFYARSKSALKELRALAGVQRLGTLEWLLARKFRVSRDRPVLERYLDDSMDRISRLDTTDILIGYLMGESNHWRLRRVALETLAARKEWDVVLNVMDGLPLRSQRDAFTVLSEMKIPVRFEWLANCILNQNDEKDWSVRHMAAQLLQFADRCEMSDDDWKRAGWDSNFMVRVELVHAMKRWKPSFIADYLLGMLHDNSIDVRIAVLQLMTEIKDPRFIEAIKSLNSPDRDLIGRSFDSIRESFLSKITR